MPYVRTLSVFLPSFLRSSSDCPDATEITRENKTPAAIAGRRIRAAHFVKLCLLLRACPTSVDLFIISCGSDALESGALVYAMLLSSSRYSRLCSNQLFAHLADAIELQTKLSTDINTNMNPNTTLADSSTENIEVPHFVIRVGAIPHPPLRITEKFAHV